MPNTHDPRQNHLLAALPAEEYALLLPKLELVPMPRMPNQEIRMRWSRDTGAPSRPSRTDTGRTTRNKTATNQTALEWR